jgi:hypothetical protein
MLGRKLIFLPEVHISGYLLRPERKSALLAAGGPRMSAHIYS